MEGHCQFEPKIRALVSPPPLLDFDCRFGLKTTALERRSIVGSNWCCSDVFCQNAAFTHLGDDFAQWRIRLPWAKVVPATIPTATVANWQLVDTAEGKNR